MLIGSELFVTGDTLADFTDDFGRFDSMVFGDVKDPFGRKFIRHQLSKSGNKAPTLTVGNTNTPAQKGTFKNINHLIMDKICPGGKLD